MKFIFVGTFVGLLVIWTTTEAWDVFPLLGILVGLVWTVLACTSTYAWLERASSP